MLDCPLLAAKSTILGVIASLGRRNARFWWTGKQIVWGYALPKSRRQTLLESQGCNANVGIVHSEKAWK